MEKIPATALGPKGTPLLGQLGRMRKDPLGLFRESSRGYGDLVRMDLARHRGYLANHPRFVKRVLVDNRQNYVLPSIYENARPVLGNGLLMSEGAQWAAHRRMMQPAFSHAHISGLAEMIGREAEGLCEWLERRKGEPFDMAEAMTRMSLSIVVKSMFGSGISEKAISDAGAAVTVLLAEAHRRYYSLVSLPLFLPNARNRLFRRALATIDGEVERVIGEARAASLRGPDLLSTLLEARYEGTDEPLSPRQLRDEVINFFMAGHETTAGALTWMWYLLALHPEADTRHRAGLGQMEGSAYTKAVLQETLRLYPPIWNFARAAAKDDDLDPFRVRKGSLIFMCPFTMHRDPRFWKDPEAFIPERFLGEGEKDMPRFAYYPFGGGPRNCIGQHFAMFQMSLILSALSRRFRFELADPASVILEAGITLRAKRGMWLRAHKA